MVPRKDRFENFVDPEVYYARGSILKSSMEEYLKVLHGRALVRQRVLEMGEDSVYNLIGITRACEMDEEDLPRLRSQITYYAYYDGKIDDLAINLVGGNLSRDKVILTNRVTAAIIAAMLALVQMGRTVVSLAPDSQTHRSIRRAIAMSGGKLVEIPADIDSLKEILENRKDISLVCITPLTHEKKHLPLKVMERAIKVCNEKKVPVLVDDAYGLARAVIYDEPGSLELGADLVVFSTDKHMVGPRCGVLVGHGDLIEKIRGKVIELGMEAQVPLYVAAYKALKKFNPQPIRHAAKLGLTLYEKLNKVYGDKIYYAGTGVVMSEEDVLEVALELAEYKKTVIVPAEAATAHAMIMLANYGALTTSTVAVPGATPHLRAMMYPDGGRLGVNKVEEAIGQAFSQLAKVLNKADEVKKILLG